MKRRLNGFHYPHFCKNLDPACEDQSACMLCHWNEENIKADEMDARNGLLRLEPVKNYILRYKAKK